MLVTYPLDETITRFPIVHGVVVPTPPEAPPPVPQAEPVPVIGPVPFPVRHPVRVVAPVPP